MKRLAIFTLLLPALGGQPILEAAMPFPVIETGRYTDSQTARKAWSAISDSAPVEVVSIQDQTALRFPCNFAGTKIARGCWDRSVTLDLSSASGVEFQLFCRDASPVSYFSIYFQSGDGWYHASFYPESSSEWNTIRIGKSETRAEGRPGGWGKIRTIRLSAWRGQDKNTEFLVVNLRATGVLGSDALVAVVRGESAAARTPSEARSVEQFTDGMSRMLEEAGIASAIVSDLDLSAARLRAARVVVLPHNPSLPDAAAEALSEYVRAGGKLAVFYTIPPRLRAALGVKSARHVKEPQPGHFARLRFAAGAPPGVPAEVEQASWNINALETIPGQSRVLAYWHDRQGQPTGHAALIGSSNGIVMTHVLLTDDAENKRRMLLALLGGLAPEIWQKSVAAGIARIGIIGGCRSFDEFAAEVSRLTAGNEHVTNALGSVRKLRDEAVRLAASRRHPEAMEAASRAVAETRRTWCLAQKPLPGEFRAFWCHSAFGVQGLDWDTAIQRLAVNGFTAIFPNMLWGGAAYYESKLLPMPARDRGDQIAQCLAACRKHGMEIHVWKVNWNLGHTAPRDIIARMRRENRLQADSRGKEEPWLCPSHPENQKLEIATMVEVARNYAVDGIHFDYIRYPDNDHCFCEGCRERFAKAVGKTVGNWPGDTLGDGPLRQAWLEWRRSNITAVVRAVSEQARAVRPKIKISAAVFRNWNTDRDNVAQDWKLWCEHGWVDFVCPMDYTSSNRQFENMVARQVEWAGRTPCYPGIGVSASSSRLEVDQVIQQIEIARRHKTQGFIIFNYGAAEANDLLPLLGLGITAKR